MVLMVALIVLNFAGIFCFGIGFLADWKLKEIEHVHAYLVVLPTTSFCKHLFAMTGKGEGVNHFFCFAMID